MKSNVTSSISRHEMRVNAIRLKWRCQRLTARMTAANAAVGRSNMTRNVRYAINTVTIPNTALRARIAKTVSPNT